MKHQVGKLARLIPGVLLAGSMAFFNPALAATGTPAPAPARAQHIKQAATAKVKQEARKKSENFNADAVTAIKQVEQAASLLKDAKYEDAVKSLESADGKLEVAMASDPSLKLIPVAEDVNTYDLTISPEEVKNELNAISKELKSGNVQDARMRLNQLRSELIIRDVYLPVETYPAAIKQAVKEVSAKQYQQAQESLDAAMNSLVEEIEVMPLPVVLANDAILDAEAKRSVDKDQAMWDLDFAHGQMLTAERLGYFYGDTDDYKTAMQHLENLRQAMGGKSEVDKLFTNAKQSVKHLIDKFSTRHSVQHRK